MNFVETGSWRRRIRVAVDRIEQISPSPVARLLDGLGTSRFRSYSMYGEDAVIHGIVKRLTFEGKTFSNFSYLDIGAWRPIVASNTYWLYRRGARGTLVEPNPHVASLLKAARPGDQVLEVACAESPIAHFYEFSPYAESNSTSWSFAHEIATTQALEIPAAREIPALSASEILEMHSRKYGTPFLVNIDAEGASEAIVASLLECSGFSPTFLIVEIDTTDGASRLPREGEWANQLASLGYFLTARCGVSAIFYRGH